MLCGHQPVRRQPARNAARCCTAPGAGARRRTSSTAALTFSAPPSLTKTVLLALMTALVVNALFDSDNGPEIAEIAGTSLGRIVLSSMVVIVVLWGVRGAQQGQRGTAGRGHSTDGAAMCYAMCVRFQMRTGLCCIFRQSASSCDRVHRLQLRNVTHAFYQAHVQPPQAMEREVMVFIWLLGGSRLCGAVRCCGAAAHARNLLAAADETDSVTRRTLVDHRIFDISWVPASLLQQFSMQLMKVGCGHVC